MLESRIRSRTARVATVGLGYVGLPLALLCSSKGYPVLGVDKDEEKVAALRRGASYITGISDEDIQTCLEQHHFAVSSDLSECGWCDVVLVSVQTPLAEGGPDYGPLLAAAEAIGESANSEQLVIVESTVGPGTIQKRVLPRLLGRNRTVGEELLLGYSPERVDPGNEQYHVEDVARLVSGVTPRCREMTGFFYDSLGVPTVAVSSPTVAEMAKLLENTYRDVNIAFINEMARICSANHIDIWEVVSAASTKPYGFSAFYPGPGVGGHCIPVDSVYYAAWAGQTGHPALLAEMARAINRSMPGYALNTIEGALSRRGKTLSGSEILLLGVTYKPDVDDVRESPAVRLTELLIARGASVAFHDPYIDTVCAGGAPLQGVDLEDDVLGRADCVILAVEHSQFDPAHLAKSCPLLVDLTGGASGSAVQRSNVVRLFG